MNPINNEKGIALVTALMLTMISLTIVMYLMYMVTSGVKLSGANKRYKTALEASYGAADMVIKEIMPTLFTATIANSLTNPMTALNTSGLYSASFFLPTGITDACLMDKLTKPSSQWGSSCSKTSDPKNSPDFKIQLQSTGSDPYIVYTKIVETICSDPRPYPTGKCTGSDLSGIDYLDGGQGTTGGSSGITVKSMPAAFRIEVQGERNVNNPIEKSRLSVLYAY
jgi:hypothetical protein